MDWKEEQQGGLQLVTSNNETGIGRKNKNKGFLDGFWDVMTVGAAGATLVAGVGAGVGAIAGILCATGTICGGEAPSVAPSVQPTAAPTVSPEPSAVPTQATEITIESEFLITYTASDEQREELSTEEEDEFLSHVQDFFQCYRHARCFVGNLPRLASRISAASSNYFDALRSQQLEGSKH